MKVGGSAGLLARCFSIGKRSAPTNNHSSRKLLGTILGILAFGVVARAAESDDRRLLDALQAPSGLAGFCVHLGCGECLLTAEWAKGDRLAVHALEADDKKVERARE